MKKKIWIVDDDEEMIKAVQLMLKLLGFETAYYLGARPAALALLSGKRPDLLFLDIRMPEVTGLDMLEFIRRRKEWKELPVIMLSTEADDITVDKAMALGANAYIYKPVTLEELEKTINKVLQNRGE